MTEDEMRFIFAVYWCDHAANCEQLLFNYLNKCSYTELSVQGLCLSLIEKGYLQGTLESLTLSDQGLDFVERRLDG